MTKLQLDKDGATASCDIAPGEVIFQQSPVVIGPGCGSKPVCLGCLRPDNVVKLSNCSKCSWPICSPECSTSNMHVEECNLLQTSNTKCQIENFTDCTNLLDFISPLRLLIKTAKDKDYFKNVEIDFEKFKRSDKASIDNLTITKLKNIFKEKSEQEIKRAVYLVEKWCLPIENGCLGLYENIPQLTHSCVPNTYYTTLTRTREIVFRASVNIARGETINFCKSDMMKCNYFRRKQLQEMGINCSCSRCKDGAEFGTNFGGLQCTNCDGIIIPSQENWKCDKCCQSKSDTDCSTILETLDKQLKEKSKHADDSIEAVMEFEQMLKRGGEWSQVPENSQLLSDIKSRLISIYQYHKDFYHLEEEYLTKKLQYCTEWLELSEKLYKGRNYSRLLIQYEKMNAAVSLMHWMKQNGKPTDDVNGFINKIVQMAREPIEMLVDEEEDSFLKAFRDLVAIATEAREEQKKRVILSMWQDDDEEEW